MKKSKFKKILSFLVLAGYLATQTIAFGGIVLCQGSDGHVAIEFADGGHCSESPIKHPDPHTHFGNSDQSILQCELSHCGDCEDIPLAFVSNYEGLPKSLTPLKSSIKQAPPPFFAISDRHRQFDTGLLPQMSIFNTFPSILRNTVLLI